MYGTTYSIQKLFLKNVLEHTPNKSKHIHKQMLQNACFCPLCKVFYTTRNVFHGIPKKSDILRAIKWICFSEDLDIFDKSCENNILEKAIAELATENF